MDFAKFEVNFGSMLVKSPLRKSILILILRFQFDIHISNANNEQSQIIFHQQMKAKWDNTYYYVIKCKLRIVVRCSIAMR